jgi:L-threonylcarbamoyladenylate synthase
VKRRGARIYCGTPKQLSFLARRLRAGELVGVPTETVYGLAADAFNARACRRIFTAKGRPVSDPLIVHLASVRELKQVAVPNAAARRLAAAFWPGPLTLVLPKTAAIPDIVSAGLPSVAVRVSAHPLFRKLLRLTGRPLAAPSANPFGYVSPTTADHVRAGLGRKIRYILDGGPARIGLESTIVDVRDPQRPRLLRPGGISHGELVRALGRPVARPRRAAGGAAPQVAPGQLPRHYSPRTPVILHPRLADRARTGAARNEAWLFLRRPRQAQGENIFWLDPKGDLPGVARRLFAVLRRLDAGGFAAIHVERARGAGLAEAINDRLRRAAAR